MAGRRPIIRQRPQVSDEPRATAWCPTHGAYSPPLECLLLRREAVADGVDLGKARAMLQRCAQLLRRCPDCEGPAPSLLAWAQRIRLAGQPPQPFVMPERRRSDPDAFEACP